jgi:hypothetical protein
MFDDDRMLTWVGMTTDFNDGEVKTMLVTGVTMRVA